MQRAEFRRTILNLEYSVYDLKAAPPRGIQAPDTSSGLFFGSIMRRLPGEGVHTAANYVQFCAVFQQGVAVRAWCDRNFNHDMTDDPPAVLSARPRTPASRSFLVDLEWAAQVGWRRHSIREKVRVVLEPGSNGHPQARVQQVFGMFGSVEMAGVARSAVLFDGNGDGLYGPEFGDGVFVDLDSDGHFDIDNTAPEFLPLSVPAPVGGRLYRAVSADPEGRWIDLEDLGAVPLQAPVRVGEAAPEFEAVGYAGERLRLADYRGRWTLLYFWASWCGNCAAQAPGLQEILKLGPTVAIVGVSFDTDRAAMEAFRRTYHETWPTTFSGRMLWEDPIGRLYRIDGPGALCLISPEGILEGIYENPSDVMGRLGKPSMGVAGRWKNAADTQQGGPR